MLRSAIPSCLLLSLIACAGSNGPGTPNTGGGPVTPASTQFAIKNLSIVETTLRVHSCPTDTHGSELIEHLEFDFTGPSAVTDLMVAAAPKPDPGFTIQTRYPIGTCSEEDRCRARSNVDQDYTAPACLVAGDERAGRIRVYSNVRVAPRTDWTVDLVNESGSKVSNTVTTTQVRVEDTSRTHLYYLSVRGPFEGTRRYSVTMACFNPKVAGRTLQARLTVAGRTTQNFEGPLRDEAALAERLDLTHAAIFFDRPGSFVGACEERLSSSDVFHRSTTTVNVQ